MNRTLTASMPTKNRYEVSKKKAGTE